MRAGHAVADDGENAHAQPAFDALNLSVAQFRIECAAYGLFGPDRLRLRDGEADRMLGAALRNQDHRDSRVAQGAEQAMRRAGHTDHAGALDVDQRHRVDRRNAFDLERRGRMRADQRAALRGRERIADVDRNIARNRRLHRLRVDHLGAEVREFHGFVVRELVDDLGIRHEPGIRREHTVHIRPNVNFERIEQGAEDRPGVIAAVASERGLQAFYGRRDESRDHESSDEIVGHEPAQIRFAFGPLDRRAERTPLDDDDLARIDPADLAGDTRPLA